ncbi:MAG: trehalase [Bacteroidota bacterium]|nr:trehalase [Bacteroidota bacterium]
MTRKQWVVCSFLVLLLSPSILPQTAKPRIVVDVRSSLRRLLEDEDTDNDQKITVNDFHVKGTERGNKSFWLHTVDGKRIEVAGTYYLSNLLQELTLAKEAHEDTAALEADHIFEPPAERIARSIRERYWSALTRTIDERGLLKILSDEKTKTIDGAKYLYIPSSDQLAFSYYTDVAKKFPQQNIKVVRLPEKVTPQYVHSLDGRHGLLSLGLQRNAEGKIEAIPFAVPGGRFNEMYGWDSYFITLGLLQDGKVELAKSMVDNFAYEIASYGAILNANRTYYLTRSQPPFFTSMIRAVYGRLPKTKENLQWLKHVLGMAIKEYHNVWMNSERLTWTGLSRYFDFGYGEPPEVEPGHFRMLYDSLAPKYRTTAQELEEEYKSGKIKIPELDRYFVHDRSMRESGHDTSYRLIGVAADLATVDLNSLLYKIETDIAAIIENEFGGSVQLENGKTEMSKNWVQRAEKRRQLVTKYLWNEQREMFFDYNVVKKEQTSYVSATTFYPMWAGLATKEQAALLVKNALPLLEQPGGISGSTEESRGPITPEHPLRQWDFPFGWSPHQMIVWQGMRNYGYDSIAARLAYKWLFTITINAAQFNGTIPEKYDVVLRSHQVFAEYGNVGTKFSYITREGFGWTNASYQIGLTLLSPELRSSLNRLISPEWIFSNNN